MLGSGGGGGDVGRSSDGDSSSTEERSSKGTSRAFPESKQQGMDATAVDEVAVCMGDEAGGISFSPPPRQRCCNLVFKDVAYSVGRGALRRAILDGVSGAARAGCATALMGPSGSGKSTLMDILAGRKAASRVRGDVRLVPAPLCHYPSAVGAKGEEGRAGDREDLAAAGSSSSSSGGGGGGRSSGRSDSYSSNSGGGGGGGSFGRGSSGVAYVEQHDTLLYNLTPREMLTYTALMCGASRSDGNSDGDGDGDGDGGGGGAESGRPAGRLSCGTRRAALDAHVDEVLTELGLGAAADTHIGVKGVYGISGGERRRTAVGVAMVMRPAALLLDEPTSGLDAHSAREVMRCLRALAQRHSLALLASVHAPSEAVFASMDCLLLLAGGRLIFAGHPSTAAAWLPAAQLQLQLAAATAAVVVDLDASGADGKCGAGGGGGGHGAAGSSMPSSALQIPLLTSASTGVAEAVAEVAYLAQHSAYGTATAADALAAVFDDSAAGEGHRHAVEGALASSSGSNSSKNGSYRGGNDKSGSSSGGSGGCAGGSVWALALRRASALALRRASALAQYRVLPTWLALPPVFALAMLVDKLCFSLVLVSLYFGLGSASPAQDPTAALNTAAVLFVHSQLAAFSGIPYVSLLFQERRVFLHEVRERLYSVPAFIAMKSLEAVPPVLITSALVNAIVWPGVGLQGSWALLWLVHAGVQMFGVLLGMLAWAAVPFVCVCEIAGGLVATAVVVLTQLGGFLITFADIPGFWAWLATINPLRFAWSALMVNQFGGSAAATVAAIPPPGLAPATGAATSSSAATTMMAAATSPLAYFGLEEESAWACLGWLCLSLPVLLVANVVAATVLVRLSRK